MRSIFSLQVPGVVEANKIYSFRLQMALQVFIDEKRACSLVCMPSVRQQEGI